MKVTKKECRCIKAWLGLPEHMSRERLFDNCPFPWDHSEKQHARCREIVGLETAPPSPIKTMGNALNRRCPCDELGVEEVKKRALKVLEENGCGSSQLTVQGDAIPGGN